MDKQFTASEVRNEASNHWRLSDGPQQTLAGKMLHAYADRLEADERAQPFMYTWSKEPDRDGVFREIPLYTHSTQAQPPAASVPDAMQELADKYHELLWAVAHKFPGETRHETALRYIREAECQKAALAAQENLNG